jgi:NAD(P)-dependent dehydrogenase (short-subunit alcohol dehydrogenase family)
MTKNILITGAGSGMGRAAAIVLSQNLNYRIILVGRDKAKLSDTLTLMNKHNPHIIMAMDIRDTSAWEVHLNSHGLTSLFAVFANAGVGGENEFGAGDRWKEIISTNLDGTYYTIQYCLPMLRNSDTPFKHILITSSCLARFGVPRYTAYCTAKTGLLGLMRSLAVELGHERILVNALTPGWVETDMAVAGVEKLAMANGRSLPEEMKIQQSIVPLQRFSQPEEIAHFVDFLFSEKQTSITGQALDINNGSFMI